MAHQAQETFVAELKDGSTVRVQRGEVFADGHEVVKLDAGRGLLFKPLDVDEPGDKAPKPAPKVSRAGKAAS